MVSKVDDDDDDDDDDDFRDKKCNQNQKKEFTINADDDNMGQSIQNGPSKICGRQPFKYLK